ncbi:hypothetical protein CAPTEDRAFT_211480 [Capitella teleta]|uniref:Uncharacterized protein n=1 Tax=Capitella teleta TaxID=283909 RepID=R7V8R3_CAPTE|nr:hypothetical protein CAPTEDRAFT_211480 [Capitella teleta]|eukprot:ELU12736.1 hypothetical protein CAPTEDRAFT_211480 [Capitella teleta]
MRNCSEEDRRAEESERGREEESERRREEESERRREEESKRRREEESERQAERILKFEEVEDKIKENTAWACRLREPSSDFLEGSVPTDNFFEDFVAAYSQVTNTSFVKANGNFAKAPNRNEILFILHFDLE